MTRFLGQKLVGRGLLPSRNAPASAPPLSSLPPPRVQVEKAALRLGMAQLLLVFDPEGAGRDVRRLLAGELSPDQAEKIRDNLDAACQALTGRR